MLYYKPLSFHGSNVESFGIDKWVNEQMNECIFENQGIHVDKINTLA